MSLVFYCLPRPGHPTFDTQYFQANPLETPEWFDDSISTEAYYEALGPIPKEATVTITLHPDSEVNQLKDLLKLYLELISTYPSAPTYEWIRKIERHTENSEKAEKPVLSIAEVVGTILQWEIAYGTFYMRFMPALNKLIASLEDSDNTKCLQEDEEAQSKHTERLRTLKEAGCTCQCFAHPPAGPASPALSSKEIQALGKLYFAMHLEQAVENFFEYWDHFRRNCALLPKDSAAWKEVARNNDWRSQARDFFKPREYIPCFTRNPAFMSETFRFPSTPAHQAILQMEKASETCPEKTSEKASEDWHLVQGGDLVEERNDERTPLLQLIDVDTASSDDFGINA